eukprot:2501903-Amphidinium_carterae.2
MLVVDSIMTCKNPWEYVWKQRMVGTPLGLPRRLQLGKAQPQAACMNNTFCLSIFYMLIAARGLSWEYHAEVCGILAVEVAVQAVQEQLARVATLLVAYYFNHNNY